MNQPFNQIVVGGLLLTGMLAAGGCAPKRIPMTVADLMEDRVTLDGVLLKCNQRPAKADADPDCLNARIAIERLAQDADPIVMAKRNETFERSRDQLRRAEDKVRADQESKARVDPYNLPIVPVDPSPPRQDPAATQPTP